MSPRQTRTATTMDQLLEQRTTRSKTQKLNNTNRTTIKSVEKKSQQSHRKKKSSDVKNEGKQSPKSSKAKKKTFSESARKKGSRRKLTLTDEAENADKSVTQENLSTNSSELRSKTELEARVRSKSNSSVQMKELTKDDGSPLNNSKLNKTPSKKLKWKIVLTGVNISASMTTPKSTPPKLSLTPHRSKKTPKKSPISLGSPKTHTKAVPRLLKSPRKLSLSSTSGPENTDKPSGQTRKKTSKKIKKNSSAELSPSDNDLSMSPVEKSKRKKSSLTPKPTVRTFSKQKRALKSRKAKKPSSPSKLRLSSPRVKKDSSKMSSPNTTLSLESSGSSGTSTPSANNRTLSSIKRRILSSKVRKLMTPSQVRDVLAEPVVLLEKLPFKNIPRITVSRTKSNMSIKVKSPLSDRWNRSKELASVLAQSPEKLYVSVDRNSGSKVKPSRARGSANRISPRNKENALTQEKERSSIPLMSSTPREENVPLLHMDLTSATPIVSLANTSFSTRSSRSRESSMSLSNLMDKSTIIANISRPSLIDRSVSGASRSYSSNSTIRQVAYDEDVTLPLEDKSKKDSTYELEQPRTVSLQRMIRKRSSTDANLTPKVDNKKIKVRFAKGTSDANSARKSIEWTASRSSISQNNARSSIMNSAHKLRQTEMPKYRQSPLVSNLRKSSLLIGQTTPTPRLGTIQNMPKTFESQNNAQSSITNSAHKLRQTEMPKYRRSPMVSNLRKSSLLIGQTTPTTRLGTTQNTSNIFLPVVKKSGNKSSVKKKPDFAKIHERMFARSESLVDAKKRLESRHMAVFGHKATPKVDIKKEEKKPLPTDTNNGTHNRFGFKLRKTEAVKMMSKRQPSLSRQKQQQETRMMLKGVRTNRRFELQMKTRNLNV